MTRFVLLLAAALLAGCSDHDHDAKGGHAGAAEHGHGGDVSITHHTAATELFVEFPRLVKGDEAAFAAHVTRLADFTALAEGHVRVRLSGGGHPDESARVAVSASAGIFRPALRPAFAGKRRLSFHIDAPGIQAVHAVGEVDVYADRKTADAVREPEAAEGIKLTKEQQWKMPFAIGVAAERALRESIGVNASIRARAAGEAHVAAPGPGLLRAGPQGFPQIGTQVKAGQIVAYLLPRMGGDTDAAALDLAVARARIENDHARNDRERLEKLFAAEAVSEKRLRDAREREDITRAQLTAAQRRASTYAGGTGGIALKSPVAGTVIAVTASPGAAVSDGQTVARIADLSRIWLEAKVPESEIARLPAPAGAFFRISGDEQLTVLEVGRNARLVSSGGLVDADTRTVPIIFEFENTRRLRLGTSLQVSLYTGRVSSGPSVPVSALVDDGGQTVVFVQLGGESFERRVVQPGTRDGDWIAITRGVKPGERVVTRGAYDVRLAAAAPATAAHGHAH